MATESRSLPPLREPRANSSRRHALVLMLGAPVVLAAADAGAPLRCLTTRRGFDTMCELNPQVARDLKVIASSSAMVVNFYIFRKNYQSVNREKLIRALLSLRASPAGGQLAALFQFDELAVQDAACLAPALSILDAADRARGRRGAGSRKDKA